MAATAKTVSPVGYKSVLTDPTPTAMDNVNGNSFVNGGKLWLRITAPAGGGTVTVAFADKVDGQAVTPRSYTFTANQVGVIGGWPVNYYGSTLIATPSAAGFTVAAFSL
ncbi:hypothetical protein F9C11_20565 [Amycolatopsis sp. VS8301801F10]|uniref:hypothetical protein n=1 Tax=unclassified Amycolatopsis TaxID=2618356 RepID=UPI0038FBFCEE